jgi:hypothetical protein
MLRWGWVHCETACHAGPIVAETGSKDGARGYWCALQGCGATRAAGHQFCCRQHGMIGDRLRADEAAINALDADALDPQRGRCIPTICMPGGGSVVGYRVVCCFIEATLEYS